MLFLILLLLMCPIAAKANPEAHKVYVVTETQLGESVVSIKKEGTLQKEGGIVTLVYGDQGEKRFTIPQEGADQVWSVVSKKFSYAGATHYGSMVLAPTTISTIPNFNLSTDAGDQTKITFIAQATHVYGPYPVSYTHLTLPTKA